MSWHADPGVGGPRMETRAEREARIAWERGGTSLLPSPGRVADRIVTIVLLALGAALTIVGGIVAVIAVVAAAARCHPSAGCSTGVLVGGGALTIGGALLIGVATAVLAIAAWLHGRSSWWIAAIGFVAATCCVVGGVARTMGT